ncbi:MAG: hypothetical protein WEB37_07075 [Bacteroidota bacterium]
MRNNDVRILELGIKDGGSLNLWREYFPQGIVVGLDINPIHVESPDGRIRTYAGPQQDTGLLDKLARENTTDGFDIIIDDCAHIGVFSRISFWHLFEHHLKSGGMYVVEDWGTGYWWDWVDGSHTNLRIGGTISPCISSSAPRGNCSATGLSNRILLP